MKKILTTAILALAAVSSVTMAQGKSAYVQDTQGNIVRSGSGLCVHTGYWTPADATIEGCDGVIAKTATPAPVVPAAPLVAPKPAPVAAVVTLSADTLFDFDRAVVKLEGKQKLDALVKSLNSMNVDAVIVVGYTDAIGTDSYNMKLSERRANAVKAYLLSSGVNADRLFVDAKGERQPVADNKTPEGRAKNRRVVVEVVGATK